MVTSWDSKPYRLPLDVEHYDVGKLLGLGNVTQERIVDRFIHKTLYRNITQFGFVEYREVSLFRRDPL
ncbi:hypothetical protein D3C81_2253290 [compost metagenome]